MELDFSPPSKSEDFLEYWEAFLPDIKERDNLKTSHLVQLRILCELYVRYDQLAAIIDENGYTFISEGGRNGDQVKARPEVQILGKTISEIRAYSQMLGLQLVKDTAVTKKEKDEDEWD